MNLRRQENSSSPLHSNLSRHGHSLLSCILFLLTFSQCFQAGWKGVSAMDQMVKVTHLKKSFGSLNVLKDVSVTLSRGEVLSIIGPSGSGKSTFLRCINAL